jgi:hypothetical protein
VSPNDVADEAPEEDFDLAADVDVLEATVVGGLRRRSVSTAAVLGGIEEAEAILANFEYWIGERVGKPFGNGHLDIMDMVP